MSQSEGKENKRNLKRRKKLEHNKNSRLVLHTSCDFLRVDVIFHEMRNPLNGVYQNAELVLQSFNNVREEILKFRENLSRSHNHSRDLSSIPFTSRDVKSVAHIVKFLEEELTADIEF